MNNNSENNIITVLAEAIDIPDSTYDKAEQRYKDLGEWFGRDKSACVSSDPHISPQGSFRLGTVIRPINPQDEYDLDLVCALEKGINKHTHSQRDLKTLIGNEVEKYREFRGIEDDMEEKQRCWRLSYKDDIKFHMDVLPCIPEDDQTRNNIKMNMSLRNKDSLFVDTASNLAVAITDNTHPLYNVKSSDWNISNPEGYALWFESRMKLMKQGSGNKMTIEKAADVDALPLYRRKTPLQRCIQILKRHRDVMFADTPDVKPISIIITTLAARAYAGENSVDIAMENILKNIERFVNTQSPRVFNPVNPLEDFAEKWMTEDGVLDRLEENFWIWLEQAKTDFIILKSTDKFETITKQIEKKYSVSTDPARIKEAIGIITPSIVVPQFSYNIKSPAKPWRQY